MILENNKTDRILIKAKSKPVIMPEENEDPKKLFHAICEAIKEGGYDPIPQIVGYVISEDPAHVTNYKNARTMIGKLDRDELLAAMVKSYIEDLEEECRDEE